MSMRRAMTRNWTWERRRCLLHRPSIWTTGRWIRDIMAQCPCPAMACIRLTGRRLVLLSRTGVIGPVLRGEAAIMMRIRGRSRIDSEACCDGAHMLAFCSAAASGMYGLIPLIMRVYYRISFRDGPVRGLIHHPGEGFRAFDHYSRNASNCYSTSITTLFKRHRLCDYHPRTMHQAVVCMSRISRWIFNASEEVSACMVLLLCYPMVPSRCGPATLLCFSAAEKWRAICL